MWVLMWVLMWLLVWLTQNCDFVCILVLEVWGSPQRAQSNYLGAMEELNGLLNNFLDDCYNNYYDDDMILILLPHTLILTHCISCMQLRLQHTVTYTTLAYCTCFVNTWIQSFSWRVHLLMFFCTLHEREGKEWSRLKGLYHTSNSCECVGV